LENIELELKKLSNKVRFILAVVEGDIIVNNRKRAELFVELKQKGFDPFPRKKQRAGPSAVGAIEEDEENEESPEAANVGSSDYEYLLSMAIGTLTLERVQQLIAEKGRMENEVAELKRTRPKSLWMRDLDAFEKELDALDEKDSMDAEERRATRNAGGGAAPNKAAPKRRPRKTATNTQAAESSDGNAAAPAVPKPAAPRKKPAGKASLADSEDEDYIAAIPKPAAQKKQPAKKASTQLSDDEDDEVLALKDRLAAYNLDDHSEDTAMETETTEEQAKGKKGRKEPSKRGAAKKAISSLAVISDDEEDETVPIDEDDEDDFAMEEVPVKKGRGKKPAAEKPKAATRKRAPAQGKSMRQKVMEEMFKPTEDSSTSAPSPEKKVRKMRASPFHKKSGSVLQRASTASTSTEETESSSPSGSSAEPVAARPKRQTRGNKKSYQEVQELSDDDTEDEVQDISDDSDFAGSDFGEDDD
jgi:DNA topoisomerase-2